jgi:hypothetical protein
MELISATTAAGLTIATLSRYSQQHLNAAQVHLVVGRITMNSDEQSTPVLQHTTTGCNTFQLFQKFPQELQDEVWKFFIELNPRRVSLRGTICEELPSPTPVFMQINQHTRNNAFTLFGYVKMKPPVRFPDAYRKTFLFHPEVDLLYYDLFWSMGQENFVVALKECNALYRIRALAINVECLATYGLLTFDFQPFKNLELLLIRATNKHVDENYQKERVRFELCPPPWHRIFRDPRPSFWNGPLLKAPEYLAALETLMARGPQRVALMIKYVANVEMERFPFGWVPFTDSG